MYRVTVNRQAHRYSSILAAIFTVSAWGTSPPKDENTMTSLTSMSVEELLKVPVVYGASKREQKVTEAPSSVSIITADQIKKFGYRTLADILHSVRGFYVNYDRNYGYIGVRGFNRPGDYGGRILLNLDGHRLNEPTYDTAPVTTDFPVDVDLIDRVEVIRGPGSALYGNNAFFAVINVITKRGRDLQGTELAGRAASFGTYQARASYGKRFGNGLEFLLSGTYFDSDGTQRLFFAPYNQPENNNGIAKNVDGDSAYRLFGSLNYGDITFRGLFSSREKYVPTASYGTTFNDPRSSTLDKRYLVELLYQHNFNNTLELKARGYYDGYDYGEYLPYGAFPGDPLFLNRDIGVADWWGGELQLSKQLFNRHRVTAGFEYRDVFKSVLRNYDIIPRTVYADIRTQSQFYSVYAQDEYAILPKMTLNAGVRYDYFSTFGGTVNPRVALIYNPWQKTTLKFLYGEAFRAPNDFERAYASAVYRPNPALRPETIHSYELLWEQYLPHNLRFSLGGFYNDIDGLISQQTDPTDGRIFFANMGNVDTLGMDFEFEAKTANGWLGRVSYTWQRTEDDHTKQVLTNSPEHLVKFNLLAPLYQDKLFAGMEVQYSSNVMTLTGGTINGYWLTNVQLFSQKLLPGLDLTGGIFNLFDYHYSFPGSGDHCQNPDRCLSAIRQDGRTFQLITRYRF